MEAERRLGTRVPEETYIQAQEAANADKLSLAQWLRQAIDKALQHQSTWERNGSANGSMVGAFREQLAEKDKQIAQKDEQITRLQESNQQQNIIIAQMTKNTERQQLMLESTQDKLERQRLPWYKRLFSQAPNPSEVRE